MGSVLSVLVNNDITGSSFLCCAIDGSGPVFALTHAMPQTLHPEPP